MDAIHFDHLARLLVGASSRRGLLGGLTAGLGLVVIPIPSAVAAKKKRKNTGGRNAFGCVDVGKACRGNNATCCSGICQGKNGTSTCAAHKVGSCQAGHDACLGFASMCGTNGICFRTTGNASFCGFGGQCAVCANDVDCEAQAGPGAACIVCDVDCARTGGTACIAAAA